VLIETLPAAFEMDEIIFELRDHMTGLNCGRWDYMFSFIKTLAAHKAYLLPDRGQLAMSEAFLASYSALLVKTCHRRGCFAMGGMAAQIPNRKDVEANAMALASVRADKEREARNGHDGTWVAHPDLVPVAMEVFNDLMPTPNQRYVTRDDVEVGQKDLLKIHQGTRTEEGFRNNVRVGVQYIESWLRGRGAVPIDNLMEDAATAEIARAQIWQWLKFGVRLESGQKVTPAYLDKCLAEEVAQLKNEIGGDTYANGRFKDAIALFKTLTTAKSFEPFLTVPAYRKIL
jgi:malate synthase